MGLISSMFRRRGAVALPGTDLLREDGPGPLLRVARQHCTAGRSDRALALLRAGVLRFPSHRDVADLLSETERAEALPQVPASLETLEGDPSSKNYARLCHLYRRTGDTDTALQFGRQAIQVDPRSPYGYRAIGRLHLVRFRETLRTVDGMNALRYLSKACALEPRHSASLLALAEIFVLLEAPRAAGRFLAPVAHSHPSDTTVEVLQRRCEALPDEETSNVQALFLRHEQALGESVIDPSAMPSEVPGDLPNHLEEFARTIDGSRGVWVVGPNRQAIAGFSHEEHTPDQVGDLGLAADTARSNCSRMGIGKFERILLRGENQLVIARALNDALTGFYIGERPSKETEVEQAFARVGISLEEANGVAR